MWQVSQTVETVRDSWNSSFPTPNIRKDALRKSHFFLLLRRAVWQGSQTVERVRDSWNSSFPIFGRTRSASPTSFCCCGVRCGRGARPWKELGTPGTRPSQHSEGRALQVPLLFAVAACGVAGEPDRGKS